LILGFHKDSCRDLSRVEELRLQEHQTICILVVLGVDDIVDD